MVRRTGAAGAVVMAVAVQVLLAVSQTAVGVDMASAAYSAEVAQAAALPVL
jgi:hypothetical protein